MNQELVEVRGVGGAVPDLVLDVADGGRRQPPDHDVGIRLQQAGVGEDRRVEAAALADRGALRGRRAQGREHHPLEQRLKVDEPGERGGGGEGVLGLQALVRQQERGERQEVLLAGAADAASAAASTARDGALPMTSGSRQSSNMTASARAMVTSLGRSGCRQARMSTSRRAARTILFVGVTGLTVGRCKASEVPLAAGP